MNKTLLLIVSLISAFLSGCSTTPTKIDTGAVKASSFSFVNGGAAPSAKFADKREAMHRSIQDAITQNLAGKGLVNKNTGGDVTVAYLVIIGDNVGTEAIRTYFGYSDDAAALSDAAFKAYSSSKNPNHFEAGTLLIDVIDSKSFKVLKRNFVVRPILRDASAEVRGERLQDAVNEALKDLRISR
jgi:hypothetical protein